MSLRATTFSCMLNRDYVSISTRIYALELVSLLLEQISYEKEQSMLATGSCSGMPYGVLEQLEVIGRSTMIKFQACGNIACKYFRLLEM